MAAAAATIAATMAWPDAVTHVGAQTFLPHGFCYLWNRDLLALHVFADSLTCVAYLGIAAALSIFAHRQRTNVPFSSVFIAFAIFIGACGATHAMDVVVLWKPLYWFSGDVKLAAAFVALATAVSLPFVLASLEGVIASAVASRRNQARFLAASETSRDAFFIYDSVRDASGAITDFRFAYANEKGARLVGSTPVDLVGSLLCDRFPVHRDELFEQYRRVAESGEPFDGEFEIRSPDVAATWIQVCVRKTDGGIAFTATDVSKRKESERRIVELAAFLESIIASSPFATIVTDRAGAIRSLNPAAERLLGYRAGEDLPPTPLAFLDPDEIRARMATIVDAGGAATAPDISLLAAGVAPGRPAESEWIAVRADGSRFDAQVTVSQLEGTGGAAIGLIVIFHDITERKRTEAYISHLAHHDALTGLSTRKLLNARIAEAIDRASRARSRAAVLMVDLDGFKRINDVMGHHAGDSVLKAAAARLAGIARPTDTVSRLGGDEFVLVLNGIEHAAEAETVARTVIAKLNEPIDVGSERLTISGSVGVAVYPESATNPEALLESADVAMYRAKSDGRRDFRTFTPDMAFLSSRRRRLEAGLRVALARGEFEVLYQPQVSMASGSVTGFEALLRWRSAEHGLVMPSEFIPLIEANGLIEQVGAWVLDTACRDAAMLRRQAGRPLRVAVNVSARQLQRGDLPEIVAGALARSGLSPDALELEITESIFVTDTSEAATVLGELRALGVRIAIDDFGTGFSGMSYIMHFPIDRLKIDRSFVREMPNDPASRAITNAVITLAADLKIDVIAEGVQTEEHREVLLRHGCDEAQGFLFSEPVSRDVLARSLRAENARPGKRRRAAAASAM
jgi:diguanylate cyclase (GGDEF)-like protein